MPRQMAPSKVSTQGLDCSLLQWSLTLASALHVWEVSLPKDGAQLQHPVGCAGHTPRCVSPSQLPGGAGAGCRRCWPICRQLPGAWQRVGCRSRACSIAGKPGTHLQPCLPTCGQLSTAVGLAGRSATPTLLDLGSRHIQLLNTTLMAGRPKTQHLLLPADHLCLYRVPISACWALLSTGALMASTTWSHSYSKGLLTSKMRSHSRGSSSSSSGSNTCAGAAANHCVWGTRAAVCMSAGDCSNRARPRWQARRCNCNQQRCCTWGALWPEA